MAKTILVADDSKTIQRVVEMTFEKTGFEVVTASSGQEAIGKVQQVQPDVVLADLHMPDSDGYSLCTSLKQQATTAHIPVVLLSCGTRPVDETKAQLARADGHINKPFDSGALIQLVKRVTGTPLESDVPLSFAATLAQRQAASAAPAPAPMPVPVFSPPAPEAAAPAQAPVPTPSLEPRPPRPASPPPVPPASVQATPTPFAPPLQEARPYPGPPESADIPLMSEDIEVEEEVLIEDAEIVDDDTALTAGGPTLEPPTPPSDLEPAENVDVWALAEGQDRSDAIEEIAIDDVTEELPPEDLEELVPDRSVHQAATRDIHEHDPTRDLAQTGLDGAVGAIAQAAAPAVADVVAPAAPGLPREELVAMAREIIEQVAWEVVPELAETIIREELRRLTAED